MFIIWANGRFGDYTIVKPEGRIIKLVNNRLISAQKKKEEWEI